VTALRAAAAERNRAPILEALATLLGERARVLEVGSGTGQHAAYFTERMPEWVWQPTDVTSDARGSIAAHRSEGSSEGFLPPLALDVEVASAWPRGHYDAVFSANVIHIAPWPVCVALVEGAARLLPVRGKLVFYGPFAFHGALSPESNRAFDRRLRSEDPRFGIRDVDAVAEVARRIGFGDPSVREMPANNHLLVFEKA
jgi:SAM-dependent methyltransferase